MSPHTTHPPRGDPFRQMTPSLTSFFFLCRVLQLSEKTKLTSSELHTPG